MNISTGNYDSKLILLSITLDTHKSDATLNLVVTPETPEDDIVPFLEKPVNEVRSYITNELLLINKKY